MDYRTRTVAGAVFLGGVGLFLLSWLGPAGETKVPVTFREASYLSVPAVLILLTSRFPVRIGPSAKISIDAALIFAMILLFPPPVVMIVTAVAVAAGDLWQRRHGYNVAFNVGQHLIMTGAAGLLLHVFGQGFALTVQNAVAIVMAALVFMVINLSLVAAVVAVRTRVPVQQSLFAIWKATWLQYTMLMMLGVLVAAFYEFAPLALGLVFIPLALIHRSYEYQVALQEQTRKTLEFLADTIDNRDAYTFAHSQRVAEYAEAIASRLGLSAEEKETIVLGARIHDIGKIGTRVEALLKKSSLTEEEWLEIRNHPVVGAKIIGGLIVYREVQDLILLHHRWYDGRGYPDDVRLSGDQIPIGARIVAVADAFDAMTSDRPYRKAMSVREAVSQLLSNSGSQFDPTVVEVFVHRVLPQELDRTVLHLTYGRVAETGPTVD